MVFEKIKISGPDAKMYKRLVINYLMKNFSVFEYNFYGRNYKTYIQNITGKRYKNKTGILFTINYITDRIYGRDIIEYECGLKIFLKKQLTKYFPEKICHVKMDKKNVPINFTING